MGNFVEGLKRGTKAFKEALDKRGEFLAGGKQVVCLIVITYILIKVKHS